MKEQRTIVREYVTRAGIGVGDLERFTNKYAPESLTAAELRQLYDSLVIELSGYENESQPLCAIPEVRRFFQSLHARWPYALYFLNLTEADLKTFLFCLLPSVEVQSEAGAVSDTVHYQRDELFKVVGVAVLAMEPVFERAGFGTGEFRKRGREMLKFFDFLKS